MKIRKGDKVRLTSGKDKGKEGEVISVNSVKNTVLVSGLNMGVKHVKKTRENEGERIEKEFPIDVSNVMFIDSEGGVTKIGYAFEDGKKVRVEKTTGKNIKDNFKKS